MEAFGISEIIVVFRANFWEMRNSIDQPAASLYWRTKFWLQVIYAENEYGDDGRWEEGEGRWRPMKGMRRWRWKWCELIEREGKGTV